MRLCGISSRFRLLSPCAGQVAHALLTRPPLSRAAFLPEEIPSARFVRLACVRHAASVHPEPGSNSHKKFVPASPFLLPFILRRVRNSLSPVFWLTVFRLHLSMPVLLNFPPASIAFRRLLRFSAETRLNLSRLFHCSVVKVVCYLSCATTSISYHSLSRLSTTF